MKPSYNSIMNYRYNYAGVDLDCDGSVYLGPADFSRGLSIDLDEALLDESQGLCGNKPIDWNGVDGIEPAVQRNLNPYPEEVEFCGGTMTVLADHDDWSAVSLPIVVPDNGGSPPAEIVIPCPGIPPP